MEQIKGLFANARRDLGIAKKDTISEVKFTYSYNALIKAGIALIARVGKVKVKSTQGHHFKIIEKLSLILKDKEVMAIGNAMRTKRNLDFYGGGTLISEKESLDYFHFVEKILGKVEKVIS